MRFRWESSSWTLNGAVSKINWDCNGERGRERERDRERREFPWAFIRTKKYASGLNYCIEYWSYRQGVCGIGFSLQVVI